MSVSPLHSLWRIVYPYLVVARVSALVLASLAYLLFYHAIRDRIALRRSWSGQADRLSSSYSSETQKDLQQIH